MNNEEIIKLLKLILEQIQESNRLLSNIESNTTAIS